MGMTGGKFTNKVSTYRSIKWGARGASATDAPVEGAPLGGTKAEAAQRLQVGLFGIAAMILLVGLASALGKQADLTEEGAVPEAAPTTEPTSVSSQRDPLADAGIVPDIPAEPSPTPMVPLDLPAPVSQGNEPTADVAPQD